MPMLSGLTFSQPCPESVREDSVLVVAFGNESLGCCNEKPGDQEGRQDDSRTALSCLRGEQQHGLATNTSAQTDRRRGKARLLQTFAAETSPQTTTTGKRNSSPCTASQGRAEPDGLERGFDTADGATGKALRGRIRECRIHASARKVAYGELADMEHKSSTSVLVRMYYTVNPGVVRNNQGVVRPLLDDAAG